MSETDWRQVRSIRPTNPKPSKIILYSRRGTKMRGMVPCDQCGILGSSYWHYGRSNRGPIVLCESCKRIAFNRSFGKIDAFDHAEQGGLFERDRRRH